MQYPSYPVRKKGFPFAMIAVLGCIVPVVLFFVFISFGAAMYRQRMNVIQNTPIGPHTLALERQMKAYEGRSAYEFAARFGGPSSMVEDKIVNVPYVWGFYDCDDGSVSTLKNDLTGIVERIDAAPKVPKD